MYIPGTPCSQCHATKLHLKREGIPFTEAVADDAAVARFRDEGFSSFPVVVAGPRSWAGYRSNEIKRLAEAFR